MKSSIVFAMLSTMLLLTITMAAPIADMFNVQVKGPCGLRCKFSINAQLRAEGKACQMTSNVLVNTMSFVTLDCRPVNRKGYRGGAEASVKTVSASAAMAAAKDMAGMLRKAKGINIEGVDPEQQIFASCPSPEPEVPVGSPQPVLPNPSTAPGTPVPSSPAPTTPGAPNPVPRGLFGVDEVDGNLDGNRCPTSSNLGNGVDVFILDSGCPPTDGGLCESFVQGEPGCIDGNGHGTHVGGTATGSEYGVATAATRHCFKVLGATGSGSTRGIVEGISRAVAHCKSTGRPCVVNMSLGGGLSSAFNAAVNDASGPGVFFALAAGNSNQDACRTSPASATVNDDFTFSVAAHDQRSQPASFTNFGSCTDLSAPGVRIMSDNGIKSGTSMASPHVAGAMAVLLSDGVTPTQSTLTATRIIPRINKPALTISC